MNWAWLGGGAAGGALSGALAMAVQFRSYLRDRDRRRMKEEVMLVFVRDMATNHLPHIYNALQKMAAQQGVELAETPLIQFVDFNGKDKGH